MLAQALLELHEKDNVTEAPGNCNTSGNLWDTGRRFFDYIRQQILPDGKTGRVAFDGMGDRICAEYKVINVQKDPRNGAARGVEVGTYRYSKVSKQQRASLASDTVWLIIFSGFLRASFTRSIFWSTSVRPGFSGCRFLQRFYTMREGTDRSCVPVQGFCSSQSGRHITAISCCAGLPVVAYISLLETRPTARQECIACPLLPACLPACLRPRHSLEQIDDALSSLTYLMS